MKSHQELLEEFPFVNEAVKFLQRILQIFSFDKNEIKVCFNGGKDATVVLYLTYFALLQLKSSQNIKCLNFVEKKPFPEAEKFIELVSEMLKLDMTHLIDGFQKGLTQQVEQNNLKAAIMGTRRDDPHGKSLDKISATDGNYPPLLRINPILEWTHCQVWIFIREFNIPFCEIYKMGYTYLGCQTKTQKNPYLEEGQYPWQLKDEHEQGSRSDFLIPQRIDKDFQN